VQSQDQFAQTCPNGCSSGACQSSSGGTPDFSLSAAPSTISIAQGGSGTVTIDAAVINNFNSQISLLVGNALSTKLTDSSGQPTSTLQSGQLVTLTINVPAGNSGIATVTVYGRSGALQHQANVIVNIVDCNYVSRGCSTTGTLQNRCGSFSNACGTTSLVTCPSSCTGGQYCAANQYCTACSAGQTSCDGLTCVNTNSNSKNCGRCGNDCTSQGKICNNGQCSSSCSSPNQICSGSCVNTNADPNCGSCGNNCAAQGKTCQGISIGIYGCVGLPPCPPATGVPSNFCTTIAPVGATSMSSQYSCTSGTCYRCNLATPVYDTSTNSCVNCLINANCPIGLSCQNKKCVSSTACGASGQNCCTTGNQCNSGLSCSSGKCAGTNISNPTQPQQNFSMSINISNPTQPQQNFSMPINISNPTQPQQNFSMPINYSKTSSSPNSLQISTNVISPFIKEQSNSFVLQARYGSPPYAWSTKDPVMPPGLTLRPDGTISGTPHITGQFPVEFVVTDNKETASSYLYINVIDVQIVNIQLQDKIKELGDAKDIILYNKKNFDTEADSAQSNGDTATAEIYRQASSILQDAINKIDSLKSWVSDPSFIFSNENKNLIDDRLKEILDLVTSANNLIPK